MAKKEPTASTRKHATFIERRVMLHKSGNGETTSVRAERGMRVRTKVGLVTVRGDTANRAQQVVKALTSRYEIPAKDIADVLEVAPRTFSRWKNDHPGLSNQQSDRMMIVGDILELGKKVLGDEAHVKAWLRKPAVPLDNQIPLELLKTESGRRKVEEGLQQIYHGFF
jgi:putative toxin-antitoxin system antitoxin component (TIGR02293 family)